jgi:hypothetical protein
MLERVKEAAVKTMDQIVGALTQHEIDTSPRTIEEETERMKEKQPEPKPAEPKQAEVKPKRGPTPAPSSNTMMARSSPRPDPRIEKKTDPAPSKPEPDYGIFAALPQRYASHRLALIARDPKWAFAYWDVDREQGAVLFEPGVQAVLRLLDANDGRVLASPRVNGESGRYYFRLPSADQRYRAALIALKGDGHEIEVLSSSVVLAAPEVPRPEREPRFVSMRVQIAVLEQAKQIINPPRLVDEDARRSSIYPTASIAGQTLTLLPAEQKREVGAMEDPEAGLPERTVFSSVPASSSEELLKKKD